VSFAASVLTLYPEMFPGPLGLSLAGRGLAEGAWSLETVQIRDFATDRHRSVDDTPAGGGAGMVMRADVLARAIDHASPPGDPRPRLLMSPRGKPLTQGRVRELAAGPGAVIVCGRFEGVDQRVIDARGLEEVSVGDYILSGGEPAAIVLLDAVVRLLPGVMGNALSGEEESFENGLLEHPHYTRPQEFEGVAIPEVLTSGNHAKIAAWRQEQAERLTGERRPDLIRRHGPYVGEIRSKVSLSIRGEKLDPVELTTLLDCEPTVSWKRGEPIRASGKALPVKSRIGHWRISTDATGDIDQAVMSLFDRLSPTVDWASLTSRFAVDISCGLWLTGYNQGFGLTIATIKFLSDRGIPIGFDVYHDDYLEICVG